MMKALKTWVLIVLLLIPVINVHAWPIPDTGQTKCHDTTTYDGTEITCPSPGQAFYGQDGSYTIDPLSYTKLDNNGTVLPDSAATWAMVKDNVTGLIWENKTSDGSIHDVAKTFTWCDTSPATDKRFQGTCGTGTGDGATDTEAFIKALNDVKFGGFSDWRMPNIKDLESILDMGRTYPAVDPTLFPSTVSNYYWSANNGAPNYVFLAWCIRFSDGTVNLGTTANANAVPTADAYAVRAVRGGQPGSLDSLVNNGDGTVTDTDTGLMWQQGPGYSMIWETALTYVEGLTLAGYDDWRLPTLKELRSIVDYGHANPAIDAALFPETRRDGYWSSTPNAGGATLCVPFWGGGCGPTGGSPDAYSVRVVRGGQSRLSGHLVISEPRRAANWKIGEQKTVTWDTAGIAGNVMISLSRQGGKIGTFTETIADGVPNNGSFKWTVTGPETINAALRVEPLSELSKGTTQSLFIIMSTWVAAEKQDDPSHYKLTLNGYADDVIIPFKATFTTSDATVATVDPSGYLTAIKNGYVEVSTIYQNKTYRKGLFVSTTNDAFESGTNDTKATANPMQISTSDPQQARFYKGRLPEGDVDFYSFTLVSPSLVNLGYLTYSATADVRVDLYDANDTLMASGTSVDGQPLMLPVGLPAGTYYLKLSKAGDVDDTNYYAVTYRIMGNLPDKSSTPIAFGETKSSSLYHLTDHTDFTFSLSEPYRAKLIFAPNSDLARYRFEILNENQTVLNQIECLSHSPVSLETNYLPGSYTLRVTPVGDVDALNSFSVEFLKVNRAEQEANNSAAQATVWNVSDPIMGILSDNTDADFYRFSLEQPRYVNLGFASPGGNKPFRLRLYKESEQNEIDVLDVQNGHMTMPIGLSIGTYYLKVESTDADTINPYTLTLTNSSLTNLEIESNNTFKVANALEKGSPKKGRIYSQNDKDYFGFHMANEGDFTVTFTPSSTVADYKITLVDAADNVYDYFSSANGQSKSILFYEMPGNYYLRVESSGDLDPSKTYELTLTSAADITGLKQPVSVTLSGSRSEMQPRDTQTLTARAGYSDASTITITPVWTSLNPAIAAVDGTGNVTAVAEGTTSIVATYGELTGKFDLKVGAPQKVVKQHYGNLILVAGGGVADTNTLKESTQYLSDLVYRRFKSRLFADEDIYYFNPMPWHDLDGDGYGEGVVDDSTPTVEKFGQAITTWAASQDTDGPLYVYLIDHGGIDSFMLFPGEIVTADQLKGWLDAFQIQTGRKVIVMIEACKSGSFTDNLITQGLDRVVVTSADDQDSYIQLGGRISFSQFFVDRLLTGDSLNAAYLKAKQQLTNMGLPYSKMHPKLVEGVNLSSARTWLGGDFVIASLFPEITETSPNTAIAANPSSPISLYAKLSSLEGIESVWAVVTDPGYMPSSTSGEFEAPTVTMPIFTLADPEKDLKYEGTYQDFIYNGDYRITFYARNTNGNVSASPATLVSVTGGLDTTFKVLTVTKGGAGTGAVTSLPAGIDCGTTCVAAFENGMAVTLAALAANDSLFAGWSGACTGMQGCNFAMNTSRSVTVTFALKLKGDVDGNGNVSLTDAILALQMTSGLPPATSVSKGGDVNADGKIGLAEVIYILQKAAGMR